MKSVKQLLYVLAGILALLYGYRYIAGVTEHAKEQCLPENRQPLPDCALMQRIGSNVTIVNQCEFPITLYWEVDRGADLIHHLDPGMQKRVTTYPLKVTGVTCCPETTFCF